MTRELLQGPHFSLERVFQSPEAEGHPAAHILCRQSLSLPFSLTCSRIKAAALAKVLPETLAPLRAHVLPALAKTIRHSVGHTFGHATTVMPVPAAHSESAEKNPA